MGDIVRKMPRSGAGLSSGEKTTFINNVIDDGSLTFQKLAASAIATQAEAEAGTSNVKLMTALRAADVLKPYFHAAATDAGIRAAATAAFAAGGGIVKIPAATIILTAPLVLQNGVIYEGSGNSIDIISNGYTPGVGTILLGDFTFNGFEFNPIDNVDPTAGGNPNPVSLCVKGAGIRNLSVGNCAYGIKIGALNKSGASPLLLENITSSNNTQWGIWIENSQLGVVSNIYSFNNDVGQLMVGASTPAFEFGNFNVFQVATQSPQLGGVGMQSAKNISFIARNGAPLNQVNVYGLQGASGNPATYGPAASTLTAASADVGVLDLSQFSLDQIVVFSATVGNIKGGIAYFVLSKSAATGAGTITVSLTMRGPVVTPDTNGSPNITTSGPTLIEIAGVGGGNAQITACNFHGISSELNSSCVLLLQSLRYTNIVTNRITNAGQISCVARDCDYSNSLLGSNPWTSIDFSDDSAHMKFDATKPTTILNNGARGRGILYNFFTNTAEINLYGFTVMAMSQNSTNYARLEAPTAFKVAEINTGQSYSNTLNGQGVSYNTSTDGTGTLVEITANQVGLSFWIANPNQSTGILTVSTAGGQLINRKAGVMSFQVYPGEFAILIAMPFGAGFYWAVLIGGDLPNQLRISTVANLPAASAVNKGERRAVTDASTTLTLGIGTTVAGGGANFVPVHSDGTNWIIG
jgi:hypothetical protein